ncbi:MAG: Crp/Fnr family transcriptional regulator [Anaerolineaceae bacterium]|nr:Crp/Fnr family transcriptional regulator [Anaerolineaceae bacterium]
MNKRRKSPIQMISTEEHHCSIDLRLKILGRLPFFTDLNQTQLKAINQRFNSLGFTKDEYIYFSGDTSERMFVVAEGKIKLFQPGFEKRNVLLNILLEGDLFGNLTVFGSSTYTDTAQSLTSSCILSISSQSFGEILEEYPSLAIKSLQVMEKRLIAANKRVFEISTLPVEQRIVVTLLTLGEKLGKKTDQGVLIDAPISREDLAEMTAATPESVSRVMKQFQNNGIIDSGRLWVSILDLAVLRKLVEIE